MDKRKNTINLRKKITEIPDDDFVDGTPAQRIAMVREIMRDTWIFLIEGLKIPVFSIEKLIKNKEATGREKDILDAKFLRTKMNKQ